LTPLVVLTFDKQYGFSPRKHHVINNMFI